MSNYILAIETSSSYLGVGLFQVSNENSIHKIEKKSVVSHFINNVHDKYLAATVSEILEINEIKVSDLSAVAVSSGPGSFTGLRIGVSFAKALCFEDGITASPKLISVPTLKVLVYEYIVNNQKYLDLNNKIVRVYLKSHKNIYYSQEFKIEIENTIKNIKILELGEVELLEILHEINSDNIHIIITNTEELSQFVKKYEFVNLNIEVLAFLGIQKFNLSQFEDAGSFVPQYSQEFQIKVV